MYAVSVVSQFMHNPREIHMDAIVRILRYLKSSPWRGVMFSKHDFLEVCNFTDADWAGSIIDKRSSSGYFTFVGGNMVTWKSKKQKVVARSSVEAEIEAWLMECVNCCGWEIWYVNWVSNLKILCSYIVTIGQLLIYRKVQSSIIVLNMWRLIVIL